MEIKVVLTKEILGIPKDIQRQYELLIDAYEKTEREIWGANYCRISKEDYLSLVESQSVYTAYLNDEVVGTICLNVESPTTCSFGLLAADFSKKGLGIGRKLIETV